MDVASLNLKFPILGFTTDDFIWGFPSLKEFGVCGPKTIKNDMQRGMEIVDSDGRRYRVLSIRKLGISGSFPMWLLKSLVTTRQYRISHEFESMTPLSLDEIKQRADHCVRAYPLGWSEEADFDTVLVETLDELRTSSSVAEIIYLLQLDWFASY